MPSIYGIGLAFVAGFAAATVDDMLLASGWTRGRRFLVYVGFFAATVLLLSRVMR